MKQAVSAPSEWVTAWGARVPEGGDVVDIAAGGGRHAAWFCGRGHAVTAIDRDVGGLSQLEPDLGPGLTVMEADLEDGGPWPLGERRFAAVVMVNYLWRPVLPDICQAVAPGGRLIVETFAMGNEAYGRPRNPAFLLRPGELLSTCRVAGLAVAAYGHGKINLNNGQVAIKQRVCGVASG